jgi:hypothetical protein
MTMEQRMDQLEKRNKRLTVALMAVVMCAVVTMAATGEKYSKFDTIIAQHIVVKNDAGKTVIDLGTSDDGDGYVATMSAKGKDLVMVSSTVMGGAITTYQPNGKELVILGTSDNGGLVYVFNKTGQRIAEMIADDYGNGLVGAWDRKGMGRELKPGP